MNRGKRAAFAAAALLCALGGLAAAAGCQKKSLADASATAAEKQLIRNPTEPPKPAADKPAPEAGAGEELRVPPELMVKLHDEFMQQGPGLGYEYVQDGDFLVSDKLPGGKQPISEITRQYYQGAAGAGDVSETTYRKQSIANFLASPVFPLKTEEQVALEASAVGQAAAAAAGPDSHWQDALSPALNPAGDWKSFKEVREFDKDYILNHDDKYYKLLVISHAENGIGSFSLQEHRDGEMANRIQQPYRLDPATGTLTLISDEGGTFMTFAVRQMAAEGDILYLKPVEDFVYTVYRRMSGVGSTPDTEGFKEKGGSNVHGGQ